MHLLRIQLTRLLNKKWFKALLILGAAFLYYLFVRLTGLGLPCYFRAITGRKCPGCGITHMIMYALNGDFIRAFLANPFLFITIPFIAFEVIFCFAREDGTGNKPFPMWNNVLLSLYIILLLIWGVLRNIIGM